mgnify:FL=1
MKKPAIINNFRNRVVGSGVEKTDQLQANAMNFRIHPDAQQQALAGAIDDIGFARSILVCRTSGNVIDGHARIALALRSGVEELPVEYVDLTEDEERKALLFIDPIAAMAASDKQKLDDLLQSVQSDDERVTEMLEEMAKREGLDYGAPPPEDAEPQIDKAEELRQKWQVGSGQMWRLGDHKIICGDCTDRAVVERVIGGEKADMVWTDPPYGVAVGDKNKYLNSIARSNRIEENLDNDTLDEPALIAMLCSSFDNAISFCTAGAAWYVAAPAVPLHILFGQVLKDRGIWRQTIQWVKNNATFSPMGVCYHWQAEPIFFGWLPNGGHHWFGGRKQTTVWNIDRPSKSPEHPTMKPVELVERAVENSSESGNIIYDPFSGSGTTIIACERLKRKCRAIEISPAYTAVAIQRWADVTGGMPELVQ